MDGVESRWKNLEKKVDGTAKSLEDKSVKLTEQHELLNELTTQLKDYEDQLASQNALGATAYDNTHLNRLKVPASAYCLNLRFCWFTQSWFSYNW